MKILLPTTILTLLLTCFSFNAKGQAGSSCANPKVIGSLPYTETNGTSCGYAGAGADSYCGSFVSDTEGREIYYSFTPTESFCYNLYVNNWQVDPDDNDFTSDLHVTISEGCPTAGGSTCIQAETINWAELTNLYFEAGKTYFFVFDHDDFNNDCIIDLDFTFERCNIPPCANNDEAADDCVNATPICDLNGYCGSTKSTHNSDANGVSHCGSIENNTWLKFTASAPTVVLNAYAYNCSTGDGIQMWVGTSNNACAWTGTDRNGVACEGGSGFGTDFNNFTINGLTPGQTYYLMIDGFAGDVCNYTIEAVSGVTPLVEAGADFTVCSTGGAFQLDGSSFAANNWTWETMGSGTFDNVNILDPMYTPSAADLAAGSVTLVINHPGAGICQTPASDTVVVSILDNSVTINASKTKICLGESVNLSASFSGAAVSANSNQTFQNNTPTNIPDDGVNSNWDGVSGTYASQQIEVECLNPNSWTFTQFCYNISHEWNSDVDGVWIVNSCGNRIKLSSNGFNNGCFNPGTNAAWTTFLGCADPNGTWELRVGDDFGSDVGTVNSFSLNFGTQNYSWSPAGSLSTTNTATTVATPTSTTTYSLLVYDCNTGCTLQDDIVIEVSDIQLSATPLHVGCNGETTGRVTLSTTNTVGNVQYKLAGGAYAFNPVFNGLGAGTYTFFAKDEAGCETSVTVTINEPSPLTLSLVSTPADACINGNNGTITALASGGTRPFGYRLGAGGYGIDSVFTGLSSGTHQIVVRDANGCTNTQSITFSDIPVATTSATAPACGDLTTTFTATSSAGAPTINLTPAAGINATFAATGNPNEYEVTADAYGDVTIEVTASNNGCDSTVSTTVTFTEQPVASFSISAPACDTRTATITVDAGVGTISLSVAPSGTITPTGNPNVFNLQVPGTGTYTVTLDRDNNGCTDNSQETVEFAATKPLNAGADQSVCSDNTTVSGTPAGGTWSSASTEISIANPSNASTSVALANGVYGSYTLTYTYPAEGTCPVQTEDVEITFFQSPDGSAGPDTVFCGIGTYNLKGSVAVGTGQWTSGPGITNVNDLNTSITINTPGSYNFELTVTNGVCPPFVDIANITVDEKPVVTLPDTIIFCALTGSLSGHTAVGNVTWSSNDSEISFSNPNVVNTSITSSSYGYFKVYLSDKNGACPASIDSTITYFVEPPVANATAADSVCGKTINLSATLSNPTNTGFWTGPGVFNPSKTDLNPTVTVTNFGTQTYTWTETATSACPSDAISLTVVYLEQPVANAGTDINVCGVDLADLNGNTSSGNGTWTWTPLDTATGTLVFSDINDANSGVTVDTNSVGFSGFGKYVVTWTEQNGTVCAPSSDDKIVYFVPSSFPNAGIDQEICGDSTAMRAIPSYGIGQWSYTGPGLLDFEDVFNPRTWIELENGNPVFGTYQLIWTEANSPCTANRDTISVVFYEPPVFDGGSSPDDICGLTYQMDASVSLGSPYWTWSAINPATGVVTFENNNDSIPNAVITVSEYGSYTLYWNVEYGPCTPQPDSVNLTFWERPEPQAQAPADVCSTSPNQTIPLTGLASSGTKWTWNGPPGVTFSPDPFQTNVDANVTQYGEYKFFFNEENHPICGVVADSVVVKVLEQPSVYAGDDANTCGANHQLDASISNGQGVGTWTVFNIISNTAGKSVALSNQNDSTSLATISPAPSVDPDTVYLVWTVQNGTSCPPVSDTVRIVYEPEPQQFFAGNDSTLCDTLRTQLNADILPSATFSGIWEKVYGPGTVTFDNGDDDIEKPIITVSEYGEYKFIWKVTTGSCPNGVVDDVILDFREKPVPDAGPDAEICGLTVDLNAGTIPARATGFWYHIPNTAVIADINALSTTATLPNGDFGSQAFVYQVQNGTIGVCAAIERDTVVATLYQQPIANAGVNQLLCGTQAQLDADSSILPPFDNGYLGEWTVISGTGNATFSPNNNMPKAVFDADQVGVYELQWKESNGVCPADSAIIEIRFVDPAQPDAGVDKDTCGLTITIDANPSFNVGRWIFDTTNVQGIFTNPNAYSTQLTVDAYGTYRVLWEETNSPCPSNIDTVFLSFNEAPNALPIPAKDTCGTQVFLSTEESVEEAQYAGKWESMDNPNLIIVAPTATTTEVLLNGEAPGLYNFRWVEENGSCPTDTAYTQANFIVIPQPEAGADSVICGLTTQLYATSSAPHDGYWTTRALDGGSANLADAANPTTQLTVNSFGRYELVWNEINFGQFNLDCAESDTVLIEFIEQPNVSLPNNILVCDIITTVQMPDTIANGTRLWSGTGLTISNPTDWETTITPTDGNFGTYTLYFEEYNRNTCYSIDSTIVTFTSQPVANAGPPIDTCGYSGQVNAVPSAGSGKWNYNGPGTLIFSNGFVNEPVQKITATAPGTYNLIWVEQGEAPCLADTSIITATFYQIPNADAGEDIETCGNETFLKAAPSVGSGKWTYKGTLPVSFDDDTDATTLSLLNSADPADYQTIVLDWTETNGGKCIDSAKVQVTFIVPPVAQAGADTEVCGLETSLLGTKNIGTDKWFSPTTNPGTVTFSNAYTAATDITVSDYGTYQFGYTVQNGFTCPPDTDFVSVTFIASPIPNAGLNDSICGNSVDLNAIPSVSGGVWSVIDGPGNATLNNAFVPNTTLTVDTEGVYTLQWTEDIPVCPSTADTISVRFETAPKAIIGNDLEICGLNTTLTGNVNPYIGNWTVFEANSTFTLADAADAQSTFDADDYGVYKLEWRIVNADLCPASADTIVLDFREQPVTNVSADQLSCEDIIEIYAIPSSGIGTWEFANPADALNASIDDAANDTTTISLLGNSYGVYPIVYKEQNGVACRIAIDTVDVEFLETPTLDIVGLPNVCGLNTELDATLSMGEGQWSVSVAGPGAAFFTSADSSYTEINVTQSGSYEFQFDAANRGYCPVVSNFAVQFFPVPNANAGADQITCGLTNEVRGATATGKGTWSCADTNLTFGNPQNLITQVRADKYGDYTIVWSEDVGPACTVSRDTVLYTFIEEPIANAGADQVVCGNQTVLSPTPSVGTGFWTSTSPDISFSPTNATNFPTITSTNFGTYELVWNEFNKAPCDTMRDVVEITFVPIPTATFTSKDTVICIGGTATLEITGTGTAPFDYTLEGSDGTLQYLNSNTNVFTVDVNPGNDTVHYVLTSVTDATVGACSNGIADSIKVAIHKQPTATISGGAIVCDGESVTYTIDFEGDAPFDYTINNGSVVSTQLSQVSVNFVPNADSTLTITTANDSICPANTFGSMTADWNANPSIDVTPLVTEVCEGDILQVEIDPSTASLPLDLFYRTNFGSNQLTNITQTEVIDLIGNNGLTYFVVDSIIDNGTSKPCSSLRNDSIPLIVNALPQLQSNLTPAVCDGQSAWIQLQFTGKAPFNVDINDGVSTQTYSGLNAMDSVSVTPLEATNYEIIQVTDGNNPQCTSTLSLANNIQTVSAPSATISVDKSVVCTGDPIEFMYSFSGTAPFDFKIGLNGTEISRTNIPGSSSETLNLFATSTLEILELSDSAPISCPAVLPNAITVTVNPYPNPNFEVLDTAGCYPFITTINNLTDPSEIASLNWDFGDGSTSTEINPSHDFNGDGFFNIGLEVTSPDNCTATFYRNTEIVVYPEPVADFTWFPEELSIDNSAVSFNNHSTESDEFTWFFGSYGTSQNKHPSFEFMLEDSLEVEVCLEAIGLCVDTICKQLSFTGKTLIHIPNAFTPNGDGKNDLFQPILIGEDVTAYDFSIFDRWGERIFHSTNPDDAWDGTYKGSKVQVGVYSYLVTIKERYSPKREEFVGHVSVLR